MGAFPKLDGGGRFPVMNRRQPRALPPRVGGGLALTRHEPMTDCL